MTLYVFQGVMDALRGRLLVRIGMRLDQIMSDRVYSTVMRLPIQAPKRGASIQPLRDLDTLRSYQSGLGPTAFFDLPWVPFYLAICFAFHVWIGVTVLTGALVLISLTLLSELLARNSSRDSNRIGNYTARIAIEPHEIARLGDVKLAPGMPVEAFIKTGDRTVGSYLTKPLFDQVARAFRER